MWPGHYLQALFNFQGIVSKKESQEACVQIRRNFDSFPNVYLIYISCSKSFNFQ